MTGVHLMTERRSCTATSKQTGKRCGSTPPPGHVVCQWHGGASPQAKAKAEERLASFVDPALTALRMLVDEADQDSVRLSAIKDILDRAGYKPVERIQEDVTGDVSIRYVNDWRSSSAG